MGIDIRMLGPAAQKQVLQKIAAQNVANVEKPRETKAKYRNQPEERGKLKFDSKKEAKRFDELMFLLRAGKIRDLKLQKDFTLQEAYTMPDGVRVRAIRYRCDFAYDRYLPNGANGDGCWEHVVEDVKSPATKTRVYAIKKKLMQERFGIEVQEV